MSPDDSSPRDYFAPPAEPVEVFCLHCGNVYCSSEMKFVPNPEGANCRNGVMGDWMCPAPGCDGVGFEFDIHPTDTWCDDEEDDEFDDDDDEFAEEAFSDFLDDSEEDSFLPAASENPDDAFTDLVIEQDWLESRNYPYARRWRMWVHFRQWTQDSSSDRSPPAGGDYDKFNEDDIPF